MINSNQLLKASNIAFKSFKLKNSLIIPLKKIIAKNRLSVNENESQYEGIQRINLALYIGSKNTGQKWRFYNGS